MSKAQPEVFSFDEVARATGISRDRLDALLASGEVTPIPGTRFISAADAVALGRRLRRGSLAAAPAPDPADLFAGHANAVRGPALPAFASSLVHATIVGLAIWVTARPVDTATTEQPVREPVRLVFLATPGPGGGGGGGGLRNPVPPPKVERRGPPRPRTSVPAVTPRPTLTARRVDEPPKRPTPAPSRPAEITPREPDPLPADVLVAPVVATAADARDRDGVIERPQGDADSRGSGTGGGTGTGAGLGNGEGSGSGIGAGSGGGTGGGPYRPGSGVEPPRLLHEVKATYTDEARRRGISGDVLLEIVIRQDGSVGEVTLLRGLGSGLDQRAIQAVRQWRFAPARRKGVPVDVLVEVAVEFMLR